MKNHRVECQLLRSMSLDIVRSGPLYMHSCRAFLLRKLGFLVLFSIPVVQNSRHWVRCLL